MLLYLFLCAIKSICIELYSIIVNMQIFIKIIKKKKLQIKSRLIISRRSKYTIYLLFILLLNRSSIIRMFSIASKINSSIFLQSYYQQFDIFLNWRYLTYRETVTVSHSCCHTLSINNSINLICKFIRKLNLFQIRLQRVILASHSHISKRTKDKSWYMQYNSDSFNVI